MKKKLLLILSLFYFFSIDGWTYSHSQINIRGVSNEMKKNIMLQWDASDKKILNDLNLGKTQLAKQTIIQIIHQSLAPFGYFNDDSKIYFYYHNNVWQININITLNKPIKISTINIILLGEGKSDGHLQKIIKQLPIRVNNIFNTSEYDVSKDQLLNAVNQLGYIKAEYLKTEVKIDLNDKTANIDWVLDTKEKYYFGRFIFQTNAYSKSFLNRFNQFKKHEVFSSEKLLSYQQELSASKYFNQVLITPDFNNAYKNEIPLLADVSVPKAQQYSFGLGYGTFTGPRLSGGMNLRRITNDGQSLTAEWKYSSVLSGLALKYFIPGRNPLKEEWSFGANYQKFVPKKGESHSLTLSGAYLKKFHHYQMNSSLNYLLENFYVNNNPIKHGEMLYPKWTLSYLKADNVISPTVGRSFEWMMQGATQNIFSSNHFFQTELKGKLFYSPFEFNNIILRADMGYSVVNDLNSLPLTMQFFAGGLNSIRGYPESSIGPGKYMMTNSFEYRHRIYNNWKAAFFYDQGIATNHIGDPLMRGKGVGIIYDSPIGPFKLYFARAIDKKGQPYQVEFSVGPEF